MNAGIYSVAIGICIYISVKFCVIVILNNSFRHGLGCPFPCTVYITQKGERPRELIAAIASVDILSIGLYMYKSISHWHRVHKTPKHMLVPTSLIIIPVKCR